MAERILVVDDEDTVRAVVRQVLEDDGYDVTEASNGEQGLEVFLKQPFAVVLSDIYMGKMSGLDLLKEIKLLDPEALVVLMTSNASLDTAASAVRSGAYDYLTKPFEDIDIVSSLVKRAVERYTLVRQNQELMSRLQQNSATLQDLNDKLQEMANRDGLTGLYNHRYFRNAFDIEIHRAGRSQGRFSLIFMDIDHFKQYNDTNGHPAGDALLKTLGEIFRKGSRASDLVCRYGGEEFVIIVPDAGTDRAILFAEALRAMVEEHPFPHRGSQPLGRISLSAGVASFPEHGTDATSLIDCADRALYEAKRSGRNRVCSLSRESVES